MKCPACQQELEDDTKELPTHAWIERAGHYKRCGVLREPTFTSNGWTCACGVDVWIIWDIEEHFKTHKDWPKLLTLAAMGDM